MKSRSVRSIQGAFYAALVLLAGAISAVFAHAAIDVAGDYLLAHDAYDGIAHHSRALFGAIALVAVALVALRFLWEALDRRASSLTGLLRGLRAARGTSGWRFVLLVSAVAFVALVAMEWTDALLDGVRIDDFADLLGGSGVLGFGIVTLTGLCVGWLVRLGLQALADWEPAIAAFFARLLPRRCDERPIVPERFRALAGSLDGACRLARRHGKRAPPLLAPA